MSFETWMAGVLQGITAPESAFNLDSLTAWATQESGPDPMRFNNPLNTTQELQAGVDIDPDFNRVGVEEYPTEWDGVTATVATLLNGRYRNIVANLRASVPRWDWSNACGDLDTWGTGCAWITENLSSAGSGTVEVEDMTPAELIQALKDAGMVGGETSIYDVLAQIESHAASIDANVAKLTAAPAATPVPGGESGPSQPVGQDVTPTPA